MKVSYRFIGSPGRFTYFYKRDNIVCWDGRLLKLKYPTECYIFYDRDEFIFKNYIHVWDFCWVFSNSEKNSDIVKDYFPAKVMSQFERNK